MSGVGTLRDSLWPSQEENVWAGPAYRGYWCADGFSRFYSVLTSEKSIVGEFDCSSAYVDLMSRILAKVLWRF